MTVAFSDLTRRERGHVIREAYRQRYSLGPLPSWDDLVDEARREA